MKLSGIVQHHSASSISAWIEDRGIWYIRYVLKKRVSSAAMARGKAVEAGIIRGVRSDLSPEQAAALALECFDAEVKQDNLVDTSEERANVSAIVMAALPHAKKVLPRNLKDQVKVEIDLGLDVPIVGYVDVLCDTVYDIKTTLRMPSDASGVKRSYWRQLAIYNLCLDRPCSLMFAGKPTKTHEGFKLIEATDYLLSKGFDEFMAAARSLERVVQLCNNKNDLMLACFPNLDSWSYSDSETAELAEKTWGL